MIDWVKKNRELLFPLLGVGVFVILLALLGKYFQGSSGSDESSKEEDIKVYEKVEIPQEQASTENGSSSSSSETPQHSKSFFLKPSASELLEQLEGLTPVEMDEKAKELPGLGVMWPLYFFMLEEGDGPILQAQLDVSEDGFGVTVVCDVDLARYPQMREVEEGEILWVAGEIIGVDPQGTGQIILRTEQIRFGGTVDQPPTAIVYENEQESLPDS